MTILIVSLFMKISGLLPRLLRTLIRKLLYAPWPFLLRAFSGICVIKLPTHFYILAGSTWGVPYPDQKTAEIVNFWITNLYRKLHRWFWLNFCVSGLCAILGLLVMPCVPWPFLLRAFYGFFWSALHSPQDTYWENVELTMTILIASLLWKFLVCFPDSSGHLLG